MIQSYLFIIINFQYSFFFMTHQEKTIEYKLETIQQTSIPSGSVPTLLVTSCSRTGVKCQSCELPVHVMHGSILPVTIPPPRAYPRGFAIFFLTWRSIPHPRDSSSTTNTLFCSKTRRFGKNFNYFLEFIERRTLYNKNMNTIFEKEN